MSLPEEVSSDKTGAAHRDAQPSPPSNGAVEAPWNRSAEAVMEALDTGPEGLSESEAKRRLERYGPNQMRSFERRGVWSILYDQLKSMVIALLVAAAGVSLFFGDYVEAGAIGGVIVVNTLIGFFTELRAVRSMEALQEFEQAEADVRREGSIREVPARELVVGDIVDLESGDVAPADLRIVEESELEMDEAALTGESVPVDKQLEPVEKEAPLAERATMTFKGTAVTRGEALGVVVATGMETEVGEVAEMVAAAGSERTPLEKRLDKLAARLVWLTLLVAAVVAASGLVAGRDTYLMLQTAVALAVAAIPEGLAIVATLALARGMWRMVERNALVRRLSSVETLGATNVICTDKTGTLTEGRMTLERVELGEQSVDIDLREGSVRFLVDSEEVEADAHLQCLLEISVLATAAEPPGEDHEAGSGDPMDIALMEFGMCADCARDDLMEERPEERLEAFSGDTKMMATFHRCGDELEVAVKGAPEAVLAASTSQLDGDESLPMDDEARRAWLERSESVAAQGFRVLAVAKRRVDRVEADPYEDLEFLGLIGFVDPAREDVRPAIETCRRAGIRVVMVTGDHPATAGHIAREVRMVDDDHTQVLDGAELEDIEQLSESDRKRLRDALIFARVSPRQKLNLIDLHQEAGDIVAMTGDGVNDAPALKSADIGVAMGQRGTEVAREAADMVLLDDAFATIETAIEQGRVIFNNIRKFVVYLLSGNVGEILAVAIAAAAGMPLPLLPLQILYLNMINDVFPALALGVGPGGEAVMERSPRDPDEPFLRGAHWGVIGAYGVVIGATVLGSFAVAAHGYGMSESEAVTVSFLTLSLGRLWHALNMRDRETTLFNNEVVANPWMWGAFAVSLALLAIAVWVEPLADILEISPPSSTGWMIILLASLVPVVLGQLYLTARRLLGRG
ncbi:MAG: cation-translocating P-type ATPase [Persicimonas sp.]